MIIVIRVSLDGNTPPSAVRLRPCLEKKSQTSITQGAHFYKNKKTKNIAQALPKLSKQSQIKQKANVMQQKQPWHVPPSM